MALWLSQWPLPSQRHGRCPAYLAEFLPSEIESADSQKSMPSRVLTQEGLHWQLAGGGPYLPSPPLMLQVSVRLRGRPLSLQQS